MKKIILGVAILIAAFSYQSSFYDCNKSYLITDGSTCIALHPTDPSKDKERPNAAWPE